MPALSSRSSAAAGGCRLCLRRSTGATGKSRCPRLPLLRRYRAGDDENPPGPVSSPRDRCRAHAVHYHRSAATAKQSQCRRTARTLTTALVRNRYTQSRGHFAPPCRHLRRSHDQGQPLAQAVKCQALGAPTRRGNRIFSSIRNGRPRRPGGAISSRTGAWPAGQVSRRLLETERSAAQRSGNHSSPSALGRLATGWSTMRR